MTEPTVEERLARLEQFEAALTEVQRCFAASEAQVEALKAAGKLKGNAMQQALATKMTYKNMLLFFERFGLSVQNKPE